MFRGNDKMLITDGVNNYVAQGKKEKHFLDSKK